MHIGEGFEGGGANAAHINLILGTRDALGSAFATAAANPGPGHIPFQAVLAPNLPAKPATLFVAKAVLTGPTHETMTWGPAQAGVAAGITEALLSGVLPAALRAAVPAELGHPSAPSLRRHHRAGDNRHRPRRLWLGRRHGRLRRLR